MENKIRLGISAFYLPLHEIKEEMGSLNAAGIDFFHLDFFDGNFVENLGMSPLDISLIRQFTTAEVDVHMSVNRPGRFLLMLRKCGADSVSIHPESDPQPAATLQEIRRLGMKAGIAIGPSLSVATVEALLPLVDYVLVMTVHPGAVGHPYLKYVENKVLQFVELQKKYHYQIVIDGGVTEDAVYRMKEYGVGMVLGTVLTSVGRDRYSETVQRLRNGGNNHGYAESR